eukprot:6179627-Pleurochrysis_carterae.AAC.2
MDAEVARLKGLFMSRIGRNWNTATRVNAQSNLGTTRGKLPWDEVGQVMLQTGPKTATPAFVADHIRNLTRSCYTFTP